MAQATEIPQVKVMTRHTLQCARVSVVSSLNAPFKLGPLDQLVSPSIPVAVVFVYKSITAQQPVCVQRLKRASELLLGYYPHLTGRLQIDEADSYIM